MPKKRFFNFILFMIFLAIEVLIALYVHDDFMRPYLGDVLVVVVLYFFVRIWIPEKYRWLPGAIFVFAAAVEVLQYFRLVEILGVENNVFLRTILGSTFDFKDIVCYGVGCLLLGFCEWIGYKRKEQ